MNIAIVGSGIIGLSTAHELLHAGHRVRAFTRDALSEITSSKAAAIWFPYLARPVAAVNRWSRESYERYLTQLDRPEAGISLVDLTVLVKEPDAWWKDAIPPGTLHTLPPEELPGDTEYGYTVKAPLIETQLYLAALEAEVLKLGGKIERSAVSDLVELADDYDLVVNCAGLGARELVGDTTMYPVKGQILKVKNRADVRHTIADYSFDAAGEQAAYLIPRRDFLIMGGTSIKGDWNTTPDPELTTGILERCRRITNANLDDVVVDEVVVGLRPGRPEIRVEREGKVIHNYGHGGAGYTVCWGCAKRVAELVG
ncbi:FAD-dependent oxidoreductase [Lewinella sp. IMCC34183]|uniref:FAD-dependent oxidoreductase n=1 Tax=Lewinella sp. IMCC34183 TaxID=2248762 RepID=UPI00130045C8|nr:FAD-dependent oxidoreductase [Lewinella sp. IMCC34183]